MNRLRCLIAGALLGCLIIGPAVNYAMAIVRFAAGLVSSNELTRSAPQTLLVGAIVGFVSGLACGVTGCRGLPTTAWVMGIAFAFYACFFGWMIRIVAAPPHYVRIAVIEIFAMTAVAGLTAYSTCVCAKACEHSWSLKASGSSLKASGTANARSASDSGRRYRL